nr:immunoglobulin heavy chain junction region [Macaca mulatta]MOV42316.1 immunoglobulin heavy chain junction region [Macaca mulatta]MOV44398.1 immunoglobulin heavy chain junction region [Macaca mulatta]
CGRRQLGYFDYW